MLLVVDFTSIHNSFLFRKLIKTDSVTTQSDIYGDSVQGIPYLLIRTELCGRTLKRWLETHKKRKRTRLLNFFEQV